MIAALAGLTGCGDIRRVAPPAAIPPPRRSEPLQDTRVRSVVVMLLHGGMDSIFVTDPRQKSEVEAWVDVPYPAGDVTEIGGLRLGPHAKALAPVAPRLAFLNGVDVGVANHEKGVLNFHRMRRDGHSRLPRLVDIVGAHREDQAVGVVSLGDGHTFGVTSSFLGPSPLSWDELDHVSPDELNRMAEALRASRQSLRALGVGSQEVASEAALDEGIAFFERLAITPKLTTSEQDRWKRRFDRILWLLENDLTRCCYFAAKKLWDTHELNTEGQTSMNLSFFGPFAKFLDDLAKRRTRRGTTLADETVVLVGSELGRYPGLNSFKGKDHFPQTSFVLAGAGVQTGGRGAMFGATGRRMEAVNVSPTTGRPGPSARPLVLDDVGVTLLRAAGIDPSPYGYDGRPLEFLVA
jgi:hypothetical protein